MVKDVLKSGILSGFVAGYPNGFNGGKYNQLFENKIKSFYKCKHAIALNSWTSGLIASVGALDVNPGDGYSKSMDNVSHCHCNPSLECNSSFCRY